MNEYREGASEIEKESRWTLKKFIPILLMIIIFFSLVGFGLNSIGLFGRTVVERKVFENSYQRSESLKSEIAMHQATLAEIESKLLNPNLNKNTRFNLKAQAGAARIRIATARSKQ